nr:MAG TPA: hypothetical protein [Caudoviricetes sp.]
MVFDATNVGHQMPADVGDRAEPWGSCLPLPLAKRLLK